MEENINREVVVVDASAVISSLVADEDRYQEVEDCIRMARKGLLLIKSPQLIDNEVANVLRWAVETGRETKKNARRHFRLYQKYPISRDVDLNMAEVLELAFEYELTVYDANYLYEAIRYKSKLVSLDKKLSKAYKLYKEKC